MKNLSIILCLFGLIGGYSVNAEANFNEKLRGFVEKILGDETANDWFGKKPERIQLPPIPDVDSKATSLDVYKENNDPNAGTVPKDVQEKQNYKFLVEVFQVVKEREPNRDDLAKWLNTLDQGATREGVYRGLILDKEYSAKEGMEYPINDSLIQFAQVFFEKYLSRTLSNNQLEQSNFYTLKRVTLEKVLDTLDIFIAQNREHYLDWYAVFSADFGKKFNKLWSKSKVRSSDNREFHRAWAEKVPYQYVKSETIIKLHLIFNHYKK